MKKKLLAIVIISIFLLLNLLALQTRAINNCMFSENNKSISIETFEGNVTLYEIPDYVKPGDLYFCEIKEKNSEPGWDHVGMYIGNDEFIEAIREGVWITNLSVLQTWVKNITYGTVKTADENQRQNAVEFAKSQLGKPFDPYKCFFMPWFKRHKDSSPDAEAWYCSELVWAAYYNQGIDIDKNGNRYPPYVGPTEISSDDDVEMYTYNKLNSYYLGRNIEWLIERVFAGIN